ncbi:MAG: hypothetical protein K2Q22_05235 [Cytophagales bacterium]|nr:hypothetical protein [Cytophagales bacterium]
MRVIKIWEHPEFDKIIVLSFGAVFLAFLMFTSKLPQYVIGYFTGDSIVSNTIIEEAEYFTTDQGNGSIYTYRIEVEKGVFVLKKDANQMLCDDQKGDKVKVIYLKSNPLVSDILCDKLVLSAIFIMPLFFGYLVYFVFILLKSSFTIIRDLKNNN